MWKINYKSGSVAVAVGAGIWLVGRHTVVGQKLCVVHAVDNDASAGAFHICRDVEPTTDEVQLLILKSVGVNRDRCRENRSVRILRDGCASMEKGQKNH